MQNYYCKLFYRNQTGKEALVSEAASEFRNYCYNYRDSLVAGVIVAGWDKELGGQVYSIPLGGMLIRQHCTIGGSGSSYVYGFIREFYREGMQKDEGIEFVKKSKPFRINIDRLPFNFNFFFLQIQPFCMPCIMMVVQVALYALEL